MSHDVASTQEEGEVGRFRSEAPEDLKTVKRRLTM